LVAGYQNKAIEPSRWSLDNKKNK